MGVGTFFGLDCSVLIIPFLSFCERCFAVDRMTNNSQLAYARLFLPLLSLSMCLWVVCDGVAYRSNRIEGVELCSESGCLKLG